MSLSGGGAWDQEKVAEFRESYLNFEKNVFINSKETGGQTCLGENLYESQVRFFDGICDGLSRGIHDFKTLKSRQLGITTRARSIGLFWLGMFDGMRGAMIFDSSTNRDNARSEVEEMIGNLPADVEFPRIKSFNREGVTLENQSVLKFLHAGGRAGKALGASMGLNLLIASELCRWENQAGIISLKQSLAKTYPNRLFIYESTARGYDGVWYEMWKEAQADDIGQKAIYVGWWAHPGQVIEETDRRWAKYGTAPLSDKEKKRIEAVYTQYGWEITAQQLAWYRWLSDPLAEKDEDEPDDADLTQEQSWTAEESWQMTGTSFFSSDVLAGRMEDAARVKPVSVWKYFPGTDFITTEFYPARTRRDVQLIVWEDPVPGASYVVAADPAFGHDEKNDRSACEVLRCFADGVEQVAEFASASTPTHQFAWLIASVVGWYGMGGTNPVVPIIEINGPGEAVWREYQQLRSIVTNGYLNIEAKSRGLNNIFNNVRQYVYTRSDAMTGGHNVHWKTTQQLKVAIMERLRDGLHTGGVLIRSTAALEEMRSIARDGDVIQGAGKAKDDRVYALAMGVRAWEEKLRLGLIAGRRTREADRARVSLSPEMRYNLFTRFQLDAMFKVKQRARLAVRQTERRALWRFR